MRPKDKALAYVVERFPGSWGRIRWLADTDAKFSDLCRDYADALETYRYWRARNGPQAREREQDYATVVAELEAEISREISESGR